MLLYQTQSRVGPFYLPYVYDKEFLSLFRGIKPLIKRFFYHNYNHHSVFNLIKIYTVLYLCSYAYIYIYVYAYLYLESESMT